MAAEHRDERKRESTIQRANQVMPSPRNEPLQNRVSPFGDIVATAERGLFMGNRGGCFHDDNQRLTIARWASRQWITCLLEFKDRKQTLMAPGRYTQLFFIDEVTALAAGHRPCFECRRPDAVHFFEALRAGVPDLVLEGKKLLVEVVDGRLHEERVDAPTKVKRTTSTALASLPDGAMVTLPQEPEQPCFIYRGKLLPWSFGGYGDAIAAPGDVHVTVLTPVSTVAALRAGYKPTIHPSAQTYGQSGR